MGANADQTMSGLDEIVINTWTHDPVAPHRSYELIAQDNLNERRASVECTGT